VDVNAAVALARSYVAGSLGIFANTGWISSGTLAIGIPDNSVVGTGTAAGTALTVGTVGATGVVEAVQISVRGTHPYTGDLGIELTSPSGTKSILKNVQDGFDGTNLDDMVLASNAFYGEPSAGIWTIKVIDGWAIGAGTFRNWQIRVFGH
jgi:subtilisin-like proprotein convertase family protein